MNDPLSKISASMIERYSKRYKELGYHVRTLGWGNEDQQQARFRASLREINFGDGKSVLDIGCGFGDFLSLLKSEHKAVKSYLGWDINPDLIQEAKGRWKNEAEFEVVNMGSYKPEFPVADIGFMFGVLNLNLKDTLDNYAYSEQFIRNAFACVNELLVVDFLSNRLHPDYPQEDFVFYHDPVKMFEFGLSISPNVKICHNYAPIPQKEFMLFLYK